MIAGFSLVASLLLAYLLNVILIRFSHRFVLAPRQQHEQYVRWATGTKPLVGGLSFFIVYLIANVVYYVAPEIFGADESVLPLALLSATTLGFLVGLADDAYSTKPLLKFLGQVGCGAIMIAFGVHIQLFDSLMLNYLLTLFWVVGIMNSINMLDNMDGITGSVSLGILASALAVMLYFGGIASQALYFIALCLAGTLAGFLLLNWHPSKLFMGDTGSQFLGVVLAFYGIVCFWNLPVATTGELIFTRQLLLPILAFLIPIIDTSFVSVMRMRRGQSPFVGGKDHITHHLSYVGLPDGIVALVVAAVTLLSGAVMFASAVVLENWSHFQTLLLLGYILANAGILLYLYRRGQHNLAVKQARAKQASGSAVVDNAEEVVQEVQPKESTAVHSR
jgi:UDP-GlcNAc:undecaprenyl-phosphate GlcNAc-1-phosphate transferase